MPQSVTLEQVVRTAQGLPLLNQRSKSNLHHLLIGYFMDRFQIWNHEYLTCAHMLSGWLILYNLSHGQGNASRLISIYRDIFPTYIDTKELSSDVGSPFTSLPSNSFYTTGLLNTGYHLLLTHNPMVEQGSLSNQPKES